MNLISIFGAGLLIGAALIIIVPEGVSVLYEAMMTPKISSNSSKDNSIEELIKSAKDESNETRELLNRYVGASLIFGSL